MKASMSNSLYWQLWCKHVADSDSINNPSDSCFEGPNHEGLF